MRVLPRRLARRPPGTMRTLTIEALEDRRVLDGGPIVTPADLEGLKIRTPGSSTRIMSFEMLGATPIKMNVGDIYLALQQGVIDGQENPFR